MTEDSGASAAPPTGGRIRAFRHEGPVPDASEMSGELERLFWAMSGPLVHKWLHYFPIYERHFGPFRGRPVRFLEIGVAKGGSLDLWRAYLGQGAEITGIDINPDCAKHDGISGRVRIGSQDDPDFLKRVVAEMGGIDIVLDDGSHDSRHVLASLDVLFPLLAPGGVYMVEDMHASYFGGLSGGYGRRGTAIETVKTMMDDLHHWYHGRGQKIAATADTLTGLHVYDSVFVLDKGAPRRPAHAVRGGR